MPLTLNSGQWSAPKAAELRPESTARQRVSATVWRLSGLLLVVASVAAWTLTYDDSSGEEVSAILGGYRSRWFLINCALSYAAIWTALHGLIRFTTQTMLRAAGVHASLLFGLLLLDVPAMLGLVDYPDLFRILRLSGFGPDRAALPNQRFEGTEYGDIALEMGLPDSPSTRYAYQTDRFSLRNPRDKTDAKVFCLGDSIVASAFVDMPHVVSERLESKLGVPVMNVAHVGIAPQESLSLLEQTGIDLRGRVVLHFIFEGNDLSDHALWRRAHPQDGPTPWKKVRAAKTATPYFFSAFHRGEPWPRSGLVSGLLWRLYRVKPGMRAQRFVDCRQPSTDQVTRAYFKYDGDEVRSSFAELPHLVATLEAAKKDIEARGGVYGVVFVPMKLNAIASSCVLPGAGEERARAMADSGLRGALAEECGRARIPFVDSTPSLQRSAYEGELPFFTHDSHLNARGQEILEEVTEPFVRERLAELARPKGGPSGIAMGSP